jgi:hypothetical protein
MSLQDTSQPERVIQRRSTARIKRISPKVRDACDLMASDPRLTITDAAKAVGLSREHLSRELCKPHVEAFLERESRRTIVRALPRAAKRTVELIDASSEHVSLDAATKVLAIGGIKPDERGHGAVNVNVSIGYVIDLSGARQAGSILPDMTHVEQVHGKPLIEHDKPGDVG